MTTEQGDVREEPAAAIAGAETIQGASERMPPVPDSIREAARLAPDHWLGMVDPAWNEDAEPPSWAVIGQWRSSPEGEIVEWRDNEDYRPSPSALGWPEPIDDVDEAVQLAATGYGPGEAVVEALAALPEAAVFVTPEGDPLPATAPDGRTRVVPVFTSPAYLQAAGRLAFEVMGVGELADRLPAGHVLYLNPSAPVSMTVDTGMLLAALEQTGADADEAGDQDDVVEPPARPATVGGSAGEDA
ncbi:hypothetical protein GCM10023196_016930 [Actinoallomurus vinaceus]|uniref:SseB protein N-terminal domain-containing protein n=1 Tax=Actinoallomurus vinaceus TaxID=1080074 RepID=A0ABP8U5A1_9ACTN